MTLLRKTWIGLAALLAFVLVFATGCPVPPAPVSDYDLGYEDGFAEDDWYWEGYYDGYDTIDFGPIFYEGGDIPDLNDDSYDDGYYDGLWIAYNDGYFVDYFYAFVLGFSEGYDNAFWPDYLNFLATDEHIEFLDGGWSDGYADGFSEGRVFGANDYEQGLPFDWEDALADYEAGTDLVFDEIGVGTGIYGPVLLYEYGTNPNEFLLKNAKSVRIERPGGVLAIRRAQGKSAKFLDDPAAYRPIIASAQQDLNVTPDVSGRSERDLRLDTTWLQRIDSYVGAAKKSAQTASVRARAR